MKYNIIINQQALATTGLDIIDAAILDYLIFICNSKNKTLEKHRIDGYTWVDYKTLYKNMPLLGIKSKNPISRRIDKIQRAGFVEKMREGNQRLYIKLTESVDKLFLKEDRAVLIEEQLPPKAVLIEERIKKIIKNKEDNDNITSVKDLQPTAADINQVIELFQEINPGRKLYGLKMQRDAASWLISRGGLKKAIALSRAILRAQERPYSPTVTTPLELKNKLAYVKRYFDREKNNLPGVVNL